MSQKVIDLPKNEGIITLKEVRCSCGKLLGKVQEGAAHEIKCPRCKKIIEGIHELAKRVSDEKAKAFIEIISTY